MMRFWKQYKNRGYRKISIAWNGLMPKSHGLTLSWWRSLSYRNWFLYKYHMISYNRDLRHERVSLISIKKWLEVFITLLTKNLNYISLCFFLVKAYNDLLKVLETRISLLKGYVSTYKTLKHLNDLETINHRGVFRTLSNIYSRGFCKNS